MHVNHTLRIRESVQERVFNDPYLNLKAFPFGIFRNETLGDLVHVRDPCGITIEDGTRVQTLLFLKRPVPQASLVLF